MEWRRPARYGAVTVGVLAVLTVANVYDEPLSPYRLADRMDPERVRESPDADLAETRGVDADGIRLIVWGGVPLEYNETRNATRFAVSFCSHRFCGPTIWILGDLRNGTTPGPWRLVPARDGEVRLERLGPARVQEPPPDAGPAMVTPPPTASGPVGPGGPPRPSIDTAFDAPFVIQSVWSPVLAHAGAYSLVLVGLALLPRNVPWHASVIGAAGGVAGVGLGATMRGEDWVLALLLSMPLLVVALVCGVVIVVQIARRKRMPMPAVAGVLFVAGYFLMSMVAFTYFPASGAGD